MRARIALVLTLALLPLALPAVAQETAPSTPPPPTRGSVWTVFSTVEAVVRDNYAIVKVIADIGNRGPDPEFPFVVRVPEDAFVTGLTITRDGTVYEATIAAREQARQQYEQHKANQMTGALVEKRRGASTYAFLVNVAEFESVRAVLTYERYLAAEEGTFRLPLEAPVSGFGQDLGAAFDVRILHSDGVSAAWGSAGSAGRDAPGGAWHLQHRVGPRGSEAATQYTATYLLNATADAGSLAVAVQGGQGYFAHRFRAPADAVQLPLDLVLVLDTSGSMQGQKMDQMRDAAAQMIARLGPDDRLHLVFFSSDAHSPWPGLKAADAAQRRLAGEEVAAALANGATNIEAGIGRGFAGFAGLDWSKEEGRLPLLVFLTDGMPTVGLTDRAALRQAARAANTHGIPVFALAFGKDADWALVQGLANDGNGTALRVPEGAGAEVDLRRFLAALTTPVLRNVVLRYDGEVTSNIQGAPILFAGSELLAVGTFPPAMQVLRGTVRAGAPDGPRAYDISEAIAGADPASFLPRLWAYQEIRRLQTLLDAEGARAAWVTALTDLAMKHGFVTDHTSLVVTLAARQVTCFDACPQFAGTRAAVAASPSSCCAAGGIAPGAPPPTTPPSSQPSMTPPSSPSPTPPPATPPAPWETLTTDASADGTPPPAPDGGSREPSPDPLLTGEVQEKSSTQAAWDQYQQDMAKTPGFEGLFALAALGLALLVVRRRA